MLTKNDLQQIREVVREEVKQEVRAEAEPIKKELKSVDNKLKLVNNKLNLIDKRLTTVENCVKWISKTFDSEIIQTRRRVDSLEKHVGIAQ